MVENSIEKCDDTIELETYNQCMKWLEEAKNGFSSWYDRQTKNKQVIPATIYVCLSVCFPTIVVHICDKYICERHCLSNAMYSIGQNIKLL